MVASCGPMSLFIGRNRAAALVPTRYGYEDVALSSAIGLMYVRCILNAVRAHERGKSFTYTFCQDVTTGWAAANDL